MCTDPRVVRVGGDLNDFDGGQRHENRERGGGCSRTHDGVVSASAAAAKTERRRRAGREERRDDDDGRFGETYGPRTARGSCEVSAVRCCYFSGTRQWLRSVGRSYVGYNDDVRLRASRGRRRRDSVADCVTRGRDEADHGRTGSAAPTLYMPEPAVARLFETRTRAAITCTGEHARAQPWTAGRKVTPPPDRLRLLLLLLLPLPLYYYYYRLPRGWRTQV